MTLHATPIETPLDVELLRQVRNVTRAGYSNHNALINRAQQREWWTANHERVRGWLYFDADRRLVGFGLLRPGDDGSRWAVVGVQPWFEGRGHGRAIMHDLVTRAQGRCRSSARRDNLAAVKLHVEDDWRVVEGPDPRLVYFETHDRLAIAAVTRPVEECRS